MSTESDTAVGGTESDLNEREEQLADDLFDVALTAIDDGVEPFSAVSGIDALADTLKDEIMVAIAEAQFGGDLTKLLEADIQEADIDTTADDVREEFLEQVTYERVKVDRGE